MGMGRESRARTTGLKESTMWLRRSAAAESEPAVLAQARSKPLEKNLLPCAVVMRAEPRVAWEAT